MYLEGSALPIVIGNSPLNSLASGFAAGAPGLAAGLRHKQDQEREDARYKEQVRLAQERLDLDKAREERSKADFERQNTQRDQVAQGYAALDQERVNSITPEQTAPGFVESGGASQAMKAGFAAPTAFAAGLMARHDKLLTHAGEVAKRLPPATSPEAAAIHERFWSDVQHGLQRDQNEAYAQKTQSDWQKLMRDVVSPHGGGGVEDLLPEVQERAESNLQMLQTAQALPPGPQRDKAIAEAQQSSRQSLDKQRSDIRETRTRRLKINSLVTSFQPAIDRKRAALYGGADGSGPVVDPDLVPTMEARLDAKQDVLERAKTDPDMTTEQFMAEWEKTNSITVPRPGRAPTGPKGPDELKIRDYLLGLWKAQHPGKKDPATGHEIEPGMPPPDGWLDREAQRMRGIMGGGPEVPEPSNAPLGQDPDFQGFDSSKPDTSTPEGKKAALRAFLEQLGIDPNAKAPEKKRGGGKLLKSTGDSKLDDFYASSPK